MDGMNHFQIYWYIALPIAKSVTATVAILTFLFSWNDFMGPLIYLSDQVKGYTCFRIDAICWAKSNRMGRIDGYFDHHDSSSYYCLYCISEILYTWIDVRRK